MLALRSRPCLSLRQPLRVPCVVRPARARVVLAPVRAAVRQFLDELKREHSA